MRQTLGLKLGIFDDSQLDRLVPKQAESGVSRPAPQLKRTTMRILIGLLVQNPDLAPLVPPLDALDQNKLHGLGLFKELVKTCLAQPVLLPDNFWNSTVAQMMLRPLKKLSMWDDIADKAIAEKPLPTHSTICLIRCCNCDKKS